MATNTTTVAACAEPKGVIYTRECVVDLLLDLAGYVPAIDLTGAVAVEPCAGEGAFLGPMIRRLMASCRLHGRRPSECESSIIAYELNESSATRARNFACEVLLSENIDREQAEALATRWIKCADYLFQDWDLRVDFVVGNPPYVRLEDMPETSAASYRQAYGTMRGRADLYIAFFEAALRQLKEGGVCAFICADRWMRNQYGAELRRLVTTGYGLDFLVEMHQANAFEDEVDAYPAITVIRKGSQRNAVVATVTAPLESDTSLLSENLLALASGKQFKAVNAVRAAVVEGWFKGSDPWPCRAPAQLALLRRLERQFVPLESEETRTRVGIGVATGNDELFITKDPVLVEESRLLKLALVEDIRSGKLQWSGHYLIDPWDCDGLVHLSDYPCLQEYFQKHATVIKKRHVATKNPHSWFRTIDRVNHELTAKPKLYIADIKNELSPVLDTGGTYPHHNLYFVESEAWDLEILGGLLLSRVAQLFVKSYGVQMRGGYFRFQAQYLRRIRVPAIQSVTQPQARELREAFRARDKARATQVALEIYAVSQQEIEEALEY